MNDPDLASKQMDEIIRQKIFIKSKKQELIDLDQKLNEQLERLRADGVFDRSYINQMGKLTRTEPKGSWHYSAAVREQIAELQTGDKYKTRESKTAYSYRLTINE